MVYIEQEIIRKRNIDGRLFREYKFIKNREGFDIPLSAINFLKEMNEAKEAGRKVQILSKRDNLIKNFCHNDINPKRCESNFDLIQNYFLSDYEDIQDMCEIHPLYPNTKIYYYARNRKDVKPQNFLRDNGKFKPDKFFENYFGNPLRKFCSEAMINVFKWTIRNLNSNSSSSGLLTGAGIIEDEDEDELISNMDEKFNLKRHRSYSDDSDYSDEDKRRRMLFGKKKKSKKNTKTKKNTKNKKRRSKK